MKRIFLLYYLLLSLPLLSQIGIGTITPDNSSILEVQSTSKGFLLPRMTQLERDAIIAPTIGLMIFNTDTNSFDCYIGPSAVPNWLPNFGTLVQAGSLNIGDTVSGWAYYDITFNETFASIPSIELSFREGTGINNSASYTAAHFKVANASISGFTIGIYETSGTSDVFIDWIATLKTQ